MLTIPNLNNARSSTINIYQANEAMPQYTYSDTMTLKQYLEAKNIQRRLQYRALNAVRGGYSPFKQEKEYMFEKQVHDLKGFIRHIVGEGSLFNKFEAMLDNLYLMFLREITVYHKLKVDREQKTDDIRIKEFREANNKLTSYLKSCEDQSKKVEQRLQHMRKTKQFYQKERENQMVMRMKKQEDQRKQALKRQAQRIHAQRKQKQQIERKSKQAQMKANEEGQNGPMAATKLQLRPHLKNQKDIEEYKKRKQHIGKLSNVFASFVGGGV